MGVVSLPTELTIRGRRYALEERLGEGATSEVWLGRCGEEELVVKVGRDASQRARLADEAQRLLLVDSPRITALIGAGFSPEGRPYLALTRARGEPLAALLDRSPSSRADLARLVARDIGAALADLHSSGLSHGDLKPENIVIELEGERPRAAVLVDLGLAGAADESVPRGGTRRYLAPEVFEPTPRGDAQKRDLWALGMVLAETLVPELRRAERPDPARFDALPDPFPFLLSALLAESPGARPSASWVSRKVQDLDAPNDEQAFFSARRRAVERSYLAIRRSELFALARARRHELVVSGLPAKWLTEALALVREVSELRGDAIVERTERLGDLSSLGRSRWLVALVGPSAAHWPAIAVESDHELAERLLAAVEACEPERLTLSALEARRRAARRWEHSLDPVELALSLESGESDPALFDRAEALVLAQPNLALGLSLGRALRRAGQLGRAFALLRRLDDREADAELAELARRAHDPELSRALAARVDDENPSAQARALATLARLELDQGRAERALELLASATESPAVLETKALAELSLGRRKAAAEPLERGRLLARTDEERARLEAVAGNIAHAEGDAEQALAAFRRAAELAARASAVVEEATYLTGVAAAASNVGELGEAIAAARRALLLFEAIGRAGDAARAELSIAAALAAAGAREEAREAAQSAAARSKRVGDRRCRAYAHLLLCDVAPASDREAVEHARFAARNLEPNGDDALRAAARLYERGEELDVAAYDARARDPATALDARFDWWGARARRAAAGTSPSRGDVVCAELLKLANVAAPVVVRGPALAAGARLAAELGDGEAARRLTLATADAARELVRRAPPELKASVASLLWVRSADAASAAEGFAPEQLRDVEALVRALGRRDGLRALLRQILDALVLWTGVERGLLLLKAPGQKLRPRAARNISRDDLSREQLELSHSLAERALELGETVVAVDAAGDLPEMHRSVHALKLRSVLAVPLIAHGEALGVVYLDDRVRRGAFGPRELSWVRLIATIAALAIADARDELYLRRAARRAQRAEAKLAKELARREAALDVAERELARARDGREHRFDYDEIVGQSEAIRAMLRVVDRVTTSDVPVLIVGESGSGKELVARAIHKNGPRGKNAFVSENCGAIPETLLESALFGHVRGAFTGASRPKAGLFEVAHRGTLFLDEIAEMSLGMQTKLLRVLQNGEVRPVGSESVRRVDVRVIGATHRDLEALVAQGKFREDLYYRLNVITVRVPPLRERPGDVALLVQSFIKRYASDRRVRVSKAALDLLSAYGWPGNVRQLENEVRRALVLADDVVLPEHLSPEVRNGGAGESGRADGLNLRERVDALEAELVRTALRRTDGNQTRAAELLGISRFGLQKMMKRLEIVSSQLVAPRLSE